MSSSRLFFLILLSVLTAPFGLCICGATLSDSVGVTLTGKVTDDSGKKGLANVYISLVGTNVGTVTNSDGDFYIYCKPDAHSEIRFSSVGYRTLSVPVDSLLNDFSTIRMRKQTLELSEVVVYGGTPADIVAEAIRKIPHNYSLSNDLISVFYRETIRKGNRFIGISEAAADVYKTSYAWREIEGDRVRINRGRRLVSQKNSDTVAIKIIGGPTLAIFADFVKNADLLFTGDDLADYEFKMKKHEYIDDRPQYVIDFRPRIKREYNQFTGKLYIDMELLAFTRAIFEMDPGDKARMTAAILHKKPRGLRFKPQKIEFVVAYRQVDGKTHISYIQNVMRFKCDLTRRLFSSSYTVHTEIVVVDRDENAETRISGKEAFRPRQIFYDLVDRYWDENYWSEYNIIAPTESLEHAVDKLKKAGRSLSTQ